MRHPDISKDSIWVKKATLTKAPLCKDSALRQGKVRPSYLSSLLNLVNV